MKAELRKQFKPLYSASTKEPGLVTVPSLPYLMIEGQGAPGGPAFQDAIGALYGTVYTLKFTLKSERKPRDFDLMPLEGLWWSDGMEMLDLEHKESWRWRLMILIPDFVNRAMLKDAIEKLAAKRGRTPALSNLRIAKFREGKAVQMMHVGPYEEEGRTMALIGELIRSKGLVVNGKHHEIYFSDPRRTAPEKLKTLLRLPVKAAPKVRAAEV